VALLALVLVMSAGSLYFFTVGPGGKTAVPRVVGSTSAVARQALAGARLEAVVVRSFDETVKAGLVRSAGDPPSP